MTAESDDLRQLTPDRIETEEDDRYLLTGPTTIAYALNDLIHRGELVTVVFDHGKGMILTALLAADADEETLVFDWGGSEQENQRLLASERNIFVAKPDGIKVQFVTGQAAETVFGDGKAFVTNLPERVVRLQRRESFRIRTPLGRPLICRLWPENGTPIDVPLRDLSVGGAGLTYSGKHVPFEAGQVFPRCRIDLPEAGEISCAAEVRHVTAGNPLSGIPSAIVGLRFRELTQPMQARIQRYIVTLERARREMSPD
jgi:c-di-GMP-binding flagellar brake protein YcgR